MQAVKLSPHGILRDRLFNGIQLRTQEMHTPVNSKPRVKSDGEGHDGGDNQKLPANAFNLPGENRDEESKKNENSEKDAGEIIQFVKGDTHEGPRQLPCGHDFERRRGNNRSEENHPSQPQDENERLKESNEVAHRSACAVLG